MSIECDECFLQEDLSHLENELENAKIETNNLILTLKEAIDIDENPSFRMFSAEEKIERMKQILTSAIRRKY